MLNFKQSLNKVTTFMLDVDGVLTDGKVLVTEDGELLRNLSSKDGYAIQLAIKKGYRIVVITGGNNEPVKKVLARSGVTDVFLRQHDKLSCYKDYVNSNNLEDAEILYMGDDLPDWEVMKRVGVATCPSDAAHEIKEICLYISDRKGGEGCVRDVIEQTMKAQNTWEIGEW